MQWWYIKCIRGLATATGYGTNSDNVIEFITIATLGNATDFGDLTSSRWHDFNEHHQLVQYFQMVSNPSETKYY